MAIKASAQITLSHIIDIMAAYRYYLLQASTLLKPDKPTTYPPNGWSDTEPSYDGTTNSLYFVDVTVYSDERFEYSEVSLSSSYEAAKLAHKKIVGRNLISYKSIAARNATYSLTANANSTTGNISSDSYAYFFIVNSTLGLFNPGEYYTISNKEIRKAYGIPPATGSPYINVRLWDVAKNAGVTNSTQLRNGASLTFQVPTTADSKNTVLYIYTASSTAVPFDIVDLKLEIGTEATEWSVAPEDTDGAISDAQSSASDANNQAHAIKSELVTLIESINSLVRGPDGGTLMKQDDNGIYFLFNLNDIEQAISDSANKIAELTGLVTTDQGHIDVLNSSVSALEQLTAYVKSYTTTEGKPCLELGEGASGFKVVITNERIGFKDGAETPAYISNRKLNIGIAQVKGELQVGDDEDAEQEGIFVWKIRANGNMGLSCRPKELVSNTWEVRRNGGTR